METVTANKYLGEIINSKENDSSTIEKKNQGCTKSYDRNNSSFKSTDQGCYKTDSTMLRDSTAFNEEI